MGGGGLLIDEQKNQEVLQKFSRLGFPRSI